MHVLFKEKMADEAFLREYTVGHEELRRHVLQYDPDTAAEVTGVPREDIVELARLYGQTSLP